MKQKEHMGMGAPIIARIILHCFKVSGLFFKSTSLDFVSVNSGII